MEIKEEREEVEILKDQETMAENIGGSKVPEEEGTNLAVSIVESVNGLKRNRPKINYDESKNQDSEESDDLCVENGGTERKKKSLRKRGKVKKEESNGVGKDKKNAGGNRKESGSEERLVKREEDGEIVDHGGNVREREELKDLVCEKEDEVSSSAEMEQAEPGQKKEQEGEDIGVEKEEGKILEKDNNKVGEQENKEGRASRSRTCSRKAREKIGKLVIDTEVTEDEDESFSRKGKRRKCQKKNKNGDGPMFKENRVQGKTAQQEGEKTKQRKRRSHNEAMGEDEGEGLKENGERQHPSRGKRAPGKVAKRQDVTKPRVGLKKDENVSRT